MRCCCCNCVFSSRAVVIIVVVVICVAVVSVQSRKVTASLPSLYGLAPWADAGGNHVKYYPLKAPIEAAIKAKSSLKP